MASISGLGNDHYPWRWALRSPYDAEFVEELKREIPYRQRKWAPGPREWWVTDSAVEQLVALAESYFGRVHHAESSQRHSALEPDLAAAYRTLYLAPDAPEEVVKAAYRTLSKKYHPDAGGTTSEMQKLNEAFERLKDK